MLSSGSLKGWAEEGFTEPSLVEEEAGLLGLRRCFGQGAINNMYMYMYMYIYIYIHVYAYFDRI